MTRWTTRIIATIAFAALLILLYLLAGCTPSAPDPVVPPVIPVQDIEIEDEAEVAPAALSRALAAQPNSRAAPTGRPSYERLRNLLGPVTMTVDPNQIVWADGRTSVTNWYGQPYQGRALVHALRLAVEGDVIALVGDHPALKVGGTGYQRVQEAARSDLKPIPRVAIVAADPANPPRIYGFNLSGSGTEGVNGFDEITLLGLNLVCDSARDAKTAMLADMKTRLGGLRIWYCDFREATSATKWNGYPRMWSIRPHGNLAYLDLQCCTFGESLEHSVVYADNIGRNGKLSRIAWNVVEGRGGSRTCIQIANRPQSGPPGQGRIIIEHNTLRCIGGNGGHAVTIAGHNGPVVVRNNHITLEGPHGGILSWSDGGHGGYYLENGFAVDAITLKNNTVIGGSRSHVSISGCGSVTVNEGFRLRQGLNENAQKCFDLETDGGILTNGPVVFRGFEPPLSAYSGFQSGARVVKRDVVLSAAAVDAMLEVEATQAP